jgi:hypothetical protein
MLRGVTLIDETLFANGLYKKRVASQGWRCGVCLLIVAYPGLSWTWKRRDVVHCDVVHCDLVHRKVYFGW